MDGDTGRGLVCDSLAGGSLAGGSISPMDRSPAGRSSGTGRRATGRSAAPGVHPNSWPHTSGGWRFPIDRARSRIAAVGDLDVTARSAHSLHPSAILIGSSTNVSEYPPTHHRARTCLYRTDGSRRIGIRTEPLESVMRLLPDRPRSADLPRSGVARGSAMRVPAAAAGPRDGRQAAARLRP